MDSVKIIEIKKSVFEDNDRAADATRHRPGWADPLNGARRCRAVRPEKYGETPFHGS